MNVTTKVGSNLLIAASTAGTDKVAETAFGTAAHQSIDGALQPVSTVNAVNYFYTYDAEGTGEKKADPTVTPYLTLTDNKITREAVDYKGYVDYVLELKAINEEATDKYINLTSLNLLYNGTAPTEKAYRVAVFVQEDASTAYEAMSTSEADAIYTLADAANFTTGQAVSGTGALSTVTYNGTFPELKAAKNSTTYYKLTFRLWIEGEDTTCSTVKFMNLDKSWGLDLAFELDSKKSSVDKIGSTDTATLTNASGTLTAALSVTGKIASTYTFYKADGSEARAASETNTYSASAGSYYCVITTTDGNQYRTPMVTVE